jgi:hypothetical protein
MDQAIPSQRPAVVFRSHYNYLRALLAVATVALVGLTAAVVILATEDEVDSRDRSENSLSVLSPKERQRVEALSSLSSAQLAAAFGHADSDRGIFPAPPRDAGSANQIQDEAGNAAAIGEPTGGPEFRGSKASEDGSAALQPVGGARP